MFEKQISSNWIVNILCVDKAGVWSMDDSLSVVLVEICLCNEGVWAGLVSPQPGPKGVATVVTGEEPFAALGEVDSGCFIVILLFEFAWKVLDRFFIMVSPSGVMIFLGHLLSLVCLIRPFL